MGSENPSSRKQKKFGVGESVCISSERQSIRKMGVPGVWQMEGSGKGARGFSVSVRRGQKKERKEEEEEKGAGNVNEGTRFLTAGNTHIAKKFILFLFFKPCRLFCWACANGVECRKGRKWALRRCVAGVVMEAFSSAQV